LLEVSCPHGVRKRCARVLPHITGCERFPRAVAHSLATCESRRGRVGESGQALNDLQAFRSPGGVRSVLPEVVDRLGRSAEPYYVLEAGPESRRVELGPGSPDVRARRGIKALSG
jgi:hypothetical protein